MMVARGGCRLAPSFSVFSDRGWHEVWSPGLSSQREGRFTLQINSLRLQTVDLIDQDVHDHRLRKKGKCMIRSTSFATWRYAAFALLMVGLVLVGSSIAQGPAP